MAAIITDKVKNRFLKDLFTDFDSSGTNYYIGIGRSQQWNPTDTPPVPQNRDLDELAFRSNLQAVIAVENKSFVVPRHLWASGNIYSPYNDAQVGYPTNPYYVITDDNAVYVCIQAPKDDDGNVTASTVQPTGVNSFNTGELADGYIWKFLYTVGAAQANAFVTSAFIPAPFVDSAGGAGDLARDTEQFNIQNAAYDGQIVGLRVTNGGSGYSGNPDITIYGDNETGYKARGYGIVNSLGQIVEARLADSNDGIATRTAHGRGYSYASAEVTSGGGTGATVVPVIGPDGGLGADARNDLRSNAVMFNSIPVGDEDGKFVVNNDYRQFGLLRNITTRESDGGPSPLFNDTSGRALRRLQIQISTPGTITLDDSIRGGTSGAVGLLDSNYNDSDLYYHQDLSLGFKSFQVGETITVGTADALVLADSEGEIDKYSGEALFISNQTGVSRSAGSGGSVHQDDLKIVIQL